MTKHSDGCMDEYPSSQESGPGAAEWHALKSALRETAPPCDGRVLFTADSLTPEQRSVCAAICASCPFAAPCGAYADAAKVHSGFWAGHRYTPKGRQ